MLPLPEYAPDPQGALLLLGQKEQYIAQLRGELMRRAIEANQLHNRVLELERQQATHQES